MSLNRYLFLLIVSFVLALAMVQVFFINSVKEQVSNEISDRSQTLSKVALQVIDDVVRPESTQNPPITTIKIESAPKERVELGDGFYFVSGENSKKVTVTTDVASSDAHSISQHVIADINLMNTGESSGNAYSVSLGADEDDSIVRRFVQFDQKSSSVTQYFERLIWVTLGLTVLGIAFAFLLAKHISGPLHRLAKGFSRLSEGKLGSRIEESGIKEVRQTLKQFNSMSDRLAHTQALENQIQQQQQLSELGEVARGLAHTLRNPLNTIGLSLEQISQPDTSESERAELAQQARRKIMHMDRSIKHLLNLANVDVDRHAKVDMNDVVQDVIMELSLSSRVSIVFQPTDSIFIFGADAEIRTMVHVLISNAVEASSSGQTVMVCANMNEEFAVLTVVDEGNGLSEKIAERLFKPHITTKPEGAGMGLFIVKRLSQSHYQGDVQIHNRREGGCKATLSLNATTNCPVENSR